MVVKSWDTDFHREAIEASIGILEEAYLDDPFFYDVSFCLPVGERPIDGWTPRSIRQCARLCVFAFNFCIVAFMIGSVILDLNVDFQILLALVVVMVAISGIDDILKSRAAVSLILRRLMKDRVRQRLSGFDSIPMISCELADPGANNEQEFFREDDYALVFFDHENRCVLIEGLRARYQIRSRDVMFLKKYEWADRRGRDYRLGTLLTYRIDATTELTIAAVREPGDYERTQQGLLWLFMSRARRNALKKNVLIGPFKETLQYSDAMAGPKEKFEVEQSSQ